MIWPCGQLNPWPRRRRGRATDGRAVGSFALSTRRGLAARYALRRGLRWPAHQGTGRPARRASPPRSGQSHRDAAASPRPLPSWSARPHGWARGSGFRQPPCIASGKSTGCSPHRVETFKLAATPEFDFNWPTSLAYYLYPPERALVLCVDAKSSCRSSALNRTSRRLPMWAGACPPADPGLHSPRPPPAFLPRWRWPAEQGPRRCYRRHRHLEFIAF